MVSLILGLIVGAASVIFALQNIFSVTVTFLAWEITGSLALIISIVAVAGLFVGILFTVPDAIKKSFEISRLKKENKKLNDELEQKRVQVVETVVVTPTDSPII